MIPVLFTKPCFVTPVYFWWKYQLLFCLHKCIVQNNVCEIKHLHGRILQNINDPTNPSNLRLSGDLPPVHGPQHPRVEGQDGRQHRRHHHQPRAHCCRRHQPGACHGLHWESSQRVLLRVWFANLACWHKKSVLNCHRFPPCMLLSIFLSCQHQHKTSKDQFFLLTEILKDGCIFFKTLVFVFFQGELGPAWASFEADQMSRECQSIYQYI